MDGITGVKNCIVTDCNQQKTNRNYFNYPHTTLLSYFFLNLFLVLGLGFSESKTNFGVYI